MKNGGAARPAAARKWRTAGKVNAAAARVRAAWRGSWSVGAACMRPAAVYPTNPFFGRDRVWSMRRGGNHAARETVVPIACSRFAWCLFCIVGRAIYLRPKSRRCAAVGHLRAKSRALRPGCAPKRRCGASPKRACGRSARRTDKIFKNVQCAAGSRPRPTERGKRSIFPQTPRGEHPCREAYMPPLQTPGIASMIPGTGGSGRFTGRMHAAPTNRPETSGERVRRVFAIDRPACERGRGFRTGARMSLAGRKETVL